VGQFAVTGTAGSNLPVTSRDERRPLRTRAPLRPFLEDVDFRLYVGDVRAVLAELPDASVDCVVTSPPYWNLRDYGTGAWEGGDDDCDHRAVRHTPEQVRASSTLVGSTDTQGNQQMPFFRDVCGLCGARRVDDQIGLEPTPDEYVRTLVDVFWQVRRVLAPHGTCWLNLGDSYAGSGPSGASYDSATTQRRREQGAQDGAFRVSPTLRDRGLTYADKKPIAPPGLKAKDQVGIPWRVALALQADGWYLRADVIWSKPNPMPESAKDRPTIAHEYVFMLTRSARYWFDQEAVREPNREAWSENGKRRTVRPGIDVNGGGQGSGRIDWNSSGRNLRSVWSIPTQPYAEAHFATFPEALVTRCVLASCPADVCRRCGKPRYRIVESDRQRGSWTPDKDPLRRGKAATVPDPGAERRTVGWTDCGHDDYRPGIGLDPFLGSGTTALVARAHGRHAIGVELNPDYAQMIFARTQQLSLFARSR